MTLEENKAIVQRWVEEAWNQGKKNVLDEIIAPDCPWGAECGPEAFKGWLSQQHTLCPDLHITIDEIVTEKDKAVVCFEFQGTLTGEIDGWVKPTGKGVTIKAMQFMRFAEGKIAEFWHLQNNLDTFQQVGIVPSTEELIRQAKAKQA